MVTALARSGNLSEQWSDIDGEPKRQALKLLNSATGRAVQGMTDCAVRRAGSGLWGWQASGSTQLVPEVCRHPPYETPAGAGAHDAHQRGTEKGTAETPCSKTMVSLRWRSYRVFGFCSALPLAGFADVDWPAFADPLPIFLGQILDVFAKLVVDMLDVFRRS